jgi:hypothetical protein
LISYITAASAVCLFHISSCIPQIPQAAHKQALGRISSPLLRHKSWTACCSRRWLKPHRLEGASGKASLNNGRMWLMRRAASKTFRLFVVSFTPNSRITVRGYTTSNPSPSRGWVSWPWTKPRLRRLRSISPFLALYSEILPGSPHK